MSESEYFALLWIEKKEFVPKLMKKAAPAPFPSAKNKDKKKKNSLEKWDFTFLWTDYAHWHYCP